MPHEKQTFEELIREDQFDDSIRDRHQAQLRAKALEVFGQVKQETPLVQPQSLSQNVPRRRVDRKLVFCYFATIAACLIGIVALTLSRGKESVVDSIVNKQQAPNITVDPQLIASLAALDSYRDDVSPEAFFSAIAMCEIDHEGRVLFDSNRP